jgi:serine/threonine protein kinase
VVVVVLLVCSAVAIAAYVRHARSKHSNSNSNSGEYVEPPAPSHASLPMSPLRHSSHMSSHFSLTPSSASVRVVEDVALGSPLGQGNFGEVYRAKWRDVDVAVKVLHLGDASAMLREMEALSTLSHPRIVRFFGCTMLVGDAAGRSGGVGLVMELCDGGSLRDYLLKHGDDTSSDHLLGACGQVAQGLAYLASQGMIHRDVACRNVLIGAGLADCRIADFGLAKVVADEGDANYYSNSAVAFRWAAPEALQDHVFSFKSDIYALAITCWEILSRGGLPFAEMPTMAQVSVAVLTRGARPGIPPGCSEEVFDVLQRAWDSDPAKRPAAADLATAFARLVSPARRRATTLNTLVAESGPATPQYGTVAEEYGSVVSEYAGADMIL